MLGHMSENRWTADRIPDQTGRTVIVTGANSGLGLATTRQLAKRGAHVIMAVRNETKGRQALASLADTQPGASLELRHLDLADLDSVRAFAERLHADGARVDVLVNNAGVMMPPRSLSPQGQESQFASNHLGHFALTGLLLDLLEAGTDPRVVTVSSSLHRRGTIHFDDLTGARKYSPSAYYAQSKFANVLFGLELHRRLSAKGSPVRSLLAHPGYAATNLQTTGPTGLAKTLGGIGNRLLAQDAEMGALPQLYAATAASAQSGQFIGPGGMAEMRGYPKVVRPVPSAEDPATAARLWTLSQELTGVSYLERVPGR
ncbi:short-chain dehydrogenase [Phytohabitans rumicis]|uniref:Short-chain dehydrogenase n=2 Tax=Phytohabitans rumicis TaxID=1076125 RepID=A0A6V8LSX6_9ACTN|nr:short-chain dehydrogenase [Phytohabitans rumicis]